MNYWLLNLNPMLGRGRSGKRGTSMWDGVHIRQEIFNENEKR